MRYLSILLCLLLLSSCQSETKKESSVLEELNIRLNADPGLINAFYATTADGRSIYQYIFLPLADYHPESLELYPILIDAIPEGQDEIVNNENFVTYEFTFKEDAKWPDGQPLVAKDYLFTILMIKHPNSQIGAWKSYFESVKKIELDSLNPRKVKVFADPNYMLSKEAVMTTCLFASHKFDAEGILMSNATQIFDPSYTATDSIEIKIVEKVNNSQFEKKEIFQIGPYTIADFQSDQYVILEANKDYWGSTYADNPFLQSYAKKIVFQFVPDELAAINMAKEGKLDFLEIRSSNTFLEMKDDEVVNKNWTFHVPEVTRYYYLALNNLSPIFGDADVRRAFAHLVDVEDIIENIDGGLATRTTGPFHPSKPYYNHKLKPIKYNLQKAIELLDKKEWIDKDGDGIREKTVNGENLKLELDFLYTGSDLAKNIGLLVQESAKSAGVKINLVSKTNTLMRSENLYTYNYDMAALARTTDEAPDDPYSNWHSDNAIPGQRNEIGYSNPEADKYIEVIRTTRKNAIRLEAYHKLQEVMYEDQPAVFLYCPLQKMMINNRLDAKTTPKRPGYLANTFKLASE